MGQYKLREHCGVFGIAGSRHAALHAFRGLYALQHRGQEGAGIVSTDGKSLYEHKNLGLVNEVFKDKRIFEKLKGTFAIGHNRYSTAGETNYINVQPITINFKMGVISAVHNGNLTNAIQLKKGMEEDGSIFQTTSDTEVILHLLARAPSNELYLMIIDALKKINGAYSLLFLSPESLIAVRDPRGFRPLNIGKLGEAYIFASESCAFDILGAEYIRQLEPGELVVVDRNLNLQSFSPFPPRENRICIFEFIYFSRPDSTIFNTSVDKVRRSFGRQLAREHPASADIVISVPDSSNTAAVGYGQETGIPYDHGLIRNHYIGRTFIMPEQDIRDADVLIKYNPVREVLKGKRVVVVDDSIVRGTTSRKLVRMIRQGGAREVHFRVASPQIKYPCFYGIDTPTSQELIASQKTVEEIRAYLDADSLGYLSKEGMLSVKELPSVQYCTACFDGAYPV
ncbi:amidophosphoribosyltransferase [bacterium]|nr:amidophosphoribosyltransferase [bacterium]